MSKVNDESELQQLLIVVSGDYHVVITVVVAKTLAIAIQHGVNGKLADQFWDVNMRSVEIYWLWRVIGH